MALWDQEALPYWRIILMRSQRFYEPHDQRLMPVLAASLRQGCKSGPMGEAVQNAAGKARMHCLKTSTDLRWRMEQRPDHSSDQARF